MKVASTILLLLPVAVGAAAYTAGCYTRDDANGGIADADKLKNGEAIYTQMCKSCHGARGEGGSGPKLRDIYLRQPLASVVKTVDERMPLGEPEKCKGSCAENVGAYVWQTLRGEIVCDKPVAVGRGLRLLTRREYSATIADLIGVGQAPGASGTACGPHTFTYDAKGRSLRTVHVAGDFNNWAATIAAGGWPLSNNNGTWSLTKQVPSGSHQYKLVLDESEWVVDASNPKTASNGIGGQNSVIDSCAGDSGSGGGGGGGTTSLDPTAGFPPDTRPEGFPFDDNGPGRVVTSVLMDEYVRAAASIAGAADLGKIVTCDRSNRDACTSQFVRDFGKRAFRRPLADTEVTRFVGVASSASDFDKGARAALRAMLISPSFAYRSEIGEKQPDGTFRLTPWEVASSLSYFFWGTMPDADLFAAAESGELAKPEVVEKQARRLMDSPRARATIATFAEQWLGAENARDLTKDTNQFPWSNDVGAAMIEETRTFFTHVMFDGTHKLDELYTADYTFVNETLSKHYGFGGVSGGDFRQVKYPDASRAGFLGHGSILATTGHSDQTSPFRRGLFVRRRLLCQEFGPPPPNAGSVPKVDPSATTRERFSQHSANSFCHSCHQYIDDVGFGFEKLDTVGRTRDNEGGKPIDASGDMNDVEGFGTNTHAPFSSMAELGKILSSSEAAKTCMTRQMFRFGRGYLDDDVCLVSPIKQRFVEKGGDLRELMIAIVTDPAFMVRQ